MDDITYDILRLITFGIGMCGATYPVLWWCGKAGLPELKKASNLLLVSSVLGTAIFFFRPDKGRWMPPVTDIICAFYWAKYVENGGEDLEI